VDTGARLFIFNSDVRKIRLAPHLPEYKHCVSPGGEGVSNELGRVWMENFVIMVYSGGMSRYMHGETEKTRQ
jgi:hypothetical protein